MRPEFLLAVLPLYSSSSATPSFPSRYLQCISGEAKQARGLALVAIGPPQSFTNHIIFPLLQGHSFGKKLAWSEAGDATPGLALAWNPDECPVSSIVRPARECHRAFHAIFKLANVAWPVVLHQRIECGRRDAFDFLLAIIGKSRKQNGSPDREYLLVFPQRRNINWHNVQPVIKIFAECSFFQRRSQIAIGGGDQAYIHFQGPCSAQPLKLALLQHAQQLHLDGRGYVADLIEKQRALYQPVQICPAWWPVLRKCASLDSRRAHFQTEFSGMAVLLILMNGPGSTMRILVNGPRDQVFADAAFTANEHRGVRWRHAFDQASTACIFLLRPTMFWNW